MAVTQIKSKFAVKLDGKSLDSHTKPQLVEYLKKLALNGNVSSRLTKHQVK